ncbi:TIGR01440 family protein [Facklamia hominis]
MHLEDEMNELMDEVIERYRSKVEAGDLFVLGCSTSEIAGGHIGKDSVPEYGQIIIKVLRERLKELELNLAVQGCEHINRSLVVEKEVAKNYGLEIVSVVPAIHAGGGCAVAAYEQFANPVMVEHIVASSGIDIGDTNIGMHIKHVQIPVRFKKDQLGGARVNGLTSRPKLIGGVRARYSL